MSGIIQTSEGLGRGHPWLGVLLQPLDRYLRHQQGIFEYSTSSDCIIRVQIAECEHDIRLADGTRLAAGDSLLNLHFWNEHIPAVPTQGFTWAWAKQFHGCAVRSLQELAKCVGERPELADVRAVRANLALESHGERMQRVLERYGFECMQRLGKEKIGAQVHRLGENIFISLLVLADNPAALRADTLWRQRVHAYLSRYALMSRYGGR